MILMRKEANIDEQIQIFTDAEKKDTKSFFSAET